MGCDHVVTLSTCGTCITILQC